jgi:hypothetical protein
MAHSSKALTAKDDMNFTVWNYQERLPSEPH